MPVTEGLGNLASPSVGADRLLAEQLDVGEQFVASQASPKAKSKATAKRVSVVGADGRTLVPRAKPRTQPLRYYSVVSGPARLLGVWHAQWDTLARHLPGGKLCGSGVRLFGFDSQEEADAKWYEYWESEPVRLPRVSP